MSECLHFAGITCAICANADWLKPTPVFSHDACQARIESLEKELAEYKDLHHRTVSLVMPGERDSPGAYMKLLRDAQRENEKLHEAMEKVRKAWLNGGAATEEMKSACNALDSALGRKG